MDGSRREIRARTEPGISIKNIGQVMDLLEANYGSRLYRDTDRKNVIALWSAMFGHDNPYEVLAAVKEWMETEPFPPTVADIKKIMRKNRGSGDGLTVDAIVEQANLLSAAHRLPMTEDLRKKYSERVEKFQTPLTKIEIKIIKKREELKGLKYL